MDKNVELFSAGLLLLKASQILYKHDEELSNLILDQSQQCTAGIQVDEKLLQEIREYGRQIEEAVNNEFESV